MKRYTFNYFRIFIFIQFSHPYWSECKPKNGTIITEQTTTRTNLIAPSTSSYKDDGVSDTTLSYPSISSLALAGVLLPGGPGVTSVVKDMFNRLLSTNGILGLRDQPYELGTPVVLRDIWTTISHYLGRNDMNSLESLENIAIEILNGFSEREKNTVHFYLYTRSNKTGFNPIKYGSLDQLKKSSFAIGKRVKFLIHGFRMNGFSHFNYLLKDAYLKHGEESNVFSVDWRHLAGDIVYFNSAFNTRIVGERVGDICIFLKKNGFIHSYDQVHLIGFSLGAHVAGYTGKYLMKMERQQLGRITGLDPAGPSFAVLTSNNRLDKGDAKFVDVIHSSLGRSGIVQSIGDVDFFPNGGADQPGCEWDKIRDYFLRNCSHERAFYLYLETIKGKKFWGCPCSNWGDYDTGKCPCHANAAGAELMGEYCNFTARGDKYLKIKETYPMASKY